MYNSRKSRNKKDKRQKRIEHEKATEYAYRTTNPNNKNNPELVAFYDTRSEKRGRLILQPTNQCK